MKKLVVYYSFEGNTKLIAESIAAEIGADLLELKSEKEIKARGFMKYFWGGKQVIMKEKPKLSPLAVNPNDYDVVILGTPVWAWDFAPAFSTFFDEVRISDKKVGLFCCCGGNAGKTFEHMKALLNGNEILGEIEFRDPLKHDKEQSAARAKLWAQELLKGLA